MPFILLHFPKGGISLDRCHQWHFYFSSFIVAAFISWVLLFFMTVLSDFQCKSNKLKKKCKKLAEYNAGWGKKGLKWVLAGPYCSCLNKDAHAKGIHGKHILTEKSELVQVFPWYKLTLICPKNFSKSKKDGNKWTLCLQRSFYDQKFIFAKRTIQKTSSLSLSKQN